MSLLHPKLQKCSFTTVSETLRLSDVSVWRCGSFSVHGVLSSGLMCEGPVSAGKRRTARTQDLVSTCLCRASAWAFRLRNSTWTKSVRVFLISNWGENLKRTFSICYNYFLHLRKWNLWELVRIQSWCSWWRPETSCFIWQKKFFVVFLLAGVSELQLCSPGSCFQLGGFQRDLWHWTVSPRGRWFSGRQRNMLKKQKTLKDPNTSWSQTEGVSPCPCEECRAPRWAARRSNLTWSREQVMRFLCTCITAWRCSPTLSHQTAATLLMSCGDILICSLRYSEAITGASLTHVPERQDYRIKRALRYQPTNT